jgi:predicted AAA+ superfamily ATPase
MAVGGMPQAVKAYVDGASLSEVDFIKREIISLYEDDFKKIDSSGRIFSMYKSVPAQLASGKKKYSINTAIGKRKNQKSEEMLYDLIDSKTINIAYNTTDPRVSLSGTKDMDSYKIYLGDTGLFVTLLFSDRDKTDENIYAKLLSDKLPANLGYLYENVVAQMIASSGRELYYHTWEKQGSTHYYELDFIISKGVKNIPIEVKSSGIGKHESLTEAKRKYRQSIYETVILSQKDIGYVDDHKNFPIYLTPFLVENTRQIYVF